MSSRGTKLLRQFLSTTLIWFVAAPLLSAVELPLFEVDVVPILKQHCFECHAGDLLEAGLDLQQRLKIFAGGESGPAIIPGSAETSLLFQKIVTGDMPPDEESVPEGEIEVIRRWIDQGALLTREETLDSVKREFAAMHVNEAFVMTNVFNSYCIVCHGKWKQEAGLDLRTRESILRGGKSGPAMVLGSPDKSLVYQRILRDEMPPKHNIFGDMTYVYRVKSTDFEKLRLWIELGAPSDSPSVRPQPGERHPEIHDDDLQHWAFQPLKRPDLPHLTSSTQVNHPIDLFLSARLEEQNLSLSPAADKRVLIRRAYFDLIGLPPSPEQMDLHLGENSPGGYEQLIEHLLESPYYGERWAQYWLDAAGYADTHGVINRDELRKYMWRYRDYVIRSLNQDKPYDQFLIEQIAGDELFDWKTTDKLTPEQIQKLIATGFLRTAPDATDEGGFNKIADRFAVVNEQLNIFSTAVMGITMECSRCHFHKFDPIPQSDYYRLAAIFRSAFDPYDWRIPNEVLYPPKFSVPPAYQRYLQHDSDALTPEVVLHNKRLQAKIDTLEQQVDEIAAPYRQRIRENRLKNAQELLAHYRFESISNGQIVNTVSGQIEGTTSATLNADRPELVGGETSLDLRGGRSATITKRPFIFHDLAGHAGNATLEFFLKPLGKPGTQSALFWTNSPEEGDRNRFNIRIETFQNSQKIISGIGADYRDPDGKNVFGISTSSHGLEVGKWYHVAILRRDLGNDGFSYEWYFNGQIDDFQSQTTAGSLPRALTWTIGGRPGFPANVLIDEVRLWRGIISPNQFLHQSTAELSAQQITHTRIPSQQEREELLNILAISKKDLDEQQRQLLARYEDYLRVDNDLLQKQFPEFAEKTASLQKEITTHTWRQLPHMLIHGLNDVGGTPTNVHIFRRGDERAPMQAVTPGVPAVLTGGVERFDQTRKENNASTGNRLVLARWLTEKDHPLTARVLVNRVWQHHFGKGLVATPGNFGRSGTPPTHPRLLDWMATEFVRQGWSIKDLHRLIMTSSAYRQSSQLTEKHRVQDPDNLLYSRFPFHRLNAEAIRDSLLQVAGRLDKTPYGPADEISTTEDGEVRSRQTPHGYRRSIYMVQRRLQPLTMLELFDAPAMVPNCLQRTESTVATQALQLFNSAFVRENAQHLAQRLIAEQDDQEQQLKRLYRLAYGRPPTPDELARAKTAMASLELFWRQESTEEKTAEQPRTRALATFCHTIFNSPEFIYVD